MTTFKPPCYCQAKMGSSEDEWKRHKPYIRHVAWQALHDKIATSEYIDHKWGKCHVCTIHARRRVAILAMFLTKLGVLTDNALGEKADSLDLN